MSRTIRIDCHHLPNVHTAPGAFPVSATGVLEARLDNAHTAGLYLMR